MADFALIQSPIDFTLIMSDRKNHETSTPAHFINCLFTILYKIQCLKKWQKQFHVKSKCQKNPEMSTL